MRLAVHVCVAQSSSLLERRKEGEEEMMTGDQKEKITLEPDHGNMLGSPAA